MNEIDNRISSLSTEKKLLLKKLLKASRIGENKYPMSNAQQRLWVSSQLHPEDTSNHILSVNRIKGDLDISLLRESLKEVVERHEVMRTSFLDEHGSGCQVVAPSMDLPFQEICLLDDEGDDKEERAYGKIAEEFNTPFRLTELPLFRVRLYHLDKDRYILSVIVHHIIFDGWSTDILSRELLTAYQQKAEGKPLRLPTLKWQYKDYAKSQKEDGYLKRVDDELKYWTQQLAGAPETVNFPFDFSRPAKAGHEGRQKQIVLDKEKTEALRAFSLKEKSTAFMTMLAVYQILLEQYTGQRDIVLGVPVAGRNDAKFEQVIGFFVNVLAIRLKTDGEDPSFRDILKSASETAVDAYAHQDVSYDLLVETLCPNRDSWALPYSQMMFIYQNTPMTNLNMAGISIEPVRLDCNVSKVDLTVELVETPEQIQIIFEYNKGIFKDETISRMMAHYTYLLDIVLENPEARLSQIPLMNEPEQRETTLLLCGRKKVYEPVSIPVLLKKQVEMKSLACALICGERKIIYGELWEKSDILSAWLVEEGYKKGQKIGVCMNRSVELYIVLLSLIKTGCVYVPLDPVYPAERRAFMAADIQAKLIIADKLWEDAGEYRNIPVLSYDSEWEIKIAKRQSPNTSVNPSDLFYIMYTSGSSGVPKGVAATYANSLNRFYWMWEDYPFQEGEVVCQKTSINFVDSIWELFGGLLQGVPTVILKAEECQNPQIMAEQLSLCKVSRLVLVPSLLDLLLSLEQADKWLSGISLWISSGEELPAVLAENFRQRFPQAILLNLYGSTEVAADVTCYDTKNLNVDSSYVPIGKPIANTAIFLLDRFGRQVAPGIDGRLCVSGAGVSPGYVNCPELNDEKFITCTGLPEQRMYLTGDMGRLVSGGNIRYLGREDFQIKIRGIRVEQGEIIAAAKSHFAVKDAVVILGQDEEPELYLYLTLRQYGLRVEELKEYLGHILPPAMVPTHLTILDELPVFPNGKLDKQKLLLLTKNNNEAKETVQPYTALQKQLQEIWAGVLGKEGIGIDEHFFLIGGQSLKAMKVVAEIYTRFQINVKLPELFRKDTMRELETMIEGKSKSAVNPIVPAGPKEQYPVSSSQKRLYIIDYLEKKSTKYNLPQALIIQGKLDIQRVEKCYRKLLERHELLRTTFHRSGNEIVQKVHKNGITDFYVTQVAEAELDYCIREFIRPFSLHELPLLRAAIIKLGPDYNCFLLDVHHIISDGYTLDLIFEELLRLYDGAGLPAQAIQYKDYACWQAKELTQNSMTLHKQYWQNRFANIPPSLELSADFPRGQRQGAAGSMFHGKIPPEVARKVRQFERMAGVTEYMFLLSCLNILMSRVSGQQEIVVGSPVEVRDKPEIAHIPGNFINVVAIKTDVKPDLAFVDYLSSVKKDVLNDFEHKDFPFEELISELNLPRDMGYNPLFGVMLAVHNNKKKIQISSGIKAYYYDIPENDVKYDLTFNVTDIDGEIHFYIEFCTDYYRESSVRRIFDQYINIMEQAIGKPERYLGDFQLLSEWDRNRILFDFNYTETDYNRDKLYYDLFEQQASMVPDRIALVAGDEALTYHQLKEKAGRIAGMLISLGLGRGGTAAVCMNRNADMIAAVLGVLKAGGAYIPLDPDYPKERLQYILEDSSTKLLLTDEVDRLQLEFSGRIVDISEVGRYEAVQAESINLSEDPAYIIYTSGSTGKPKGVVVSHRALNNFCIGVNQKIPFDEASVILCCTTISFDIFVLESLLPLVYGSRIVLADVKQQMDRKALCSLIINQGVNMLQMVPTRLQSILSAEKAAEMFSGIRYVMIGGEEFGSELVEALKKSYHGRIFNMYGPTETTVWSTIKELTHETEITIGCPISNTQIYILDEKFCPVPIGMEGDLYIGGDGVANGYFHNPELSRERFIPNPFTGIGRIYKTGDRAQWMENGEIKYKGRSDFQVKIGGYRIECGEIEHAMLTYPLISQAAVTKIGTYTDACLCGYFTAYQAVDSNSLREYISRKLPHYMVPHMFCQLDKLPLTPNRKIDRKSLPVPQKGGQGDKVETVSQTEKTIAAIWEDVLGIPTAGATDNFFDLGGNSLLLMEMHSRLDEHYPGRVDITDIFANPTIRRIAGFIELRDRRDRGNGIKLIELPDEFYSESRLERAGELFRINLSEIVTGVLHLIARDYNTSPAVILAAMYLYMLSLVSKDKNIALWAAFAVDQELFCMRDDFGKYDEDSLKHYLSQIVKMCEEKTDNPHAVLMKAETIRNTRGIWPLFYENGSLVDKWILRTDDAFCVEAELYDSFVQLTCECRSNWIVPEKAEELFLLYNDVLEALAEQYEP